jgi:hypothetical protein
MSTTGAMGKAGLVDEVPGRGATMHGTSRPCLRGTVISTVGELAAINIPD